MKKWAVIIGIILIFLGVISFLFCQDFGPPGKNAEIERLVLAEDLKDEEIAKILQEKKLIKNQKVFLIVLDVKGWRKKIQPGGYYLMKNMNAYQLAKTMISGPAEKWVLIPPGKRKEQVALILKKALSWPDGLVRNFILTAKEGYLFPDTYLIKTDADPQQIVVKLKNNFNEKFTAEMQKVLLANNIRNDTAIKIASLIERESGGDEDKALIAGIIWNRLEKGMKLEIDATVQYAQITDKLITDNRSLFTDNFDFWPVLGPGIVRNYDSLYNTYKIKALPPGPICSPGLSSIKAAVYPAETEALFYLHSPDKKIHPAKTYKEHQENIAKYLK